MRIRADQESILNRFRCSRVRDIDKACLASIKGPTINGKASSNIPDLFRDEMYIKDDRTGALASYVIKNDADDILMFFSIRCGELFENVDHQKMILSHNALVAVKKLAEYGQQLPDEDVKKAYEAISRALDAGLGYEEFAYYGKKKQHYLNDASKEPNKEVSRVYTVYSGVELKFFGINENAKGYWKTLGFNRKMGETLFWRFVIPKLEELREVVGCQYLFLFAADQEAEGRLVNYYRSVLHINASPHLSSNKPMFDYSSLFLYQEIAKMSEYKEKFFDEFNRDVKDIENV